MPAHIVAVNATHALVPDRLGDLELTGIDKRPLDGRVLVRTLGVDSDQQFDTRHHGGPDQAVYVYAAEDQEWWSRELGRDVHPGQFGENITTAGLDVTGAVIGERWQAGPAVVLEVSAPRIPCRTFQGWMGEDHWVKRFTQYGAPGAYCRVLSEGTVAAGDEITVLHRPAHGVTIGEVFVPRRTEPDRLRALLAEPGIADSLAKAVGKALTAWDSATPTR
jgi:MOSC domain-containing protein YiiM